MSEFTQHVEFMPAFDWKRDKPSEDYGIGTVRIKFTLKGPLGAVQWMIGTDWTIQPVRERISPPSDPRKPTGWDLGYHSPKPRYDGQTSMGQCSVLGCECYYDGSGLNADLLIEGFLARGDKWVWEKLQEYYECVFNDAPFPEFNFTYLPYPKSPSSQEQEI